QRETGIALERSLVGGNSDLRHGKVVRKLVVAQSLANGEPGILVRAQAEPGGPAVQRFFKGKPTPVRRGGRVAPTVVDRTGVGEPGGGILETDSTHQEARRVDAIEHQRIQPALRYRRELSGGGDRGVGEIGPRGE